MTSVSILEHTNWVGTLEYYNQRDLIFKRETSSSGHPYYEKVGSKYAARFLLETKKQLSAKGQIWIDAVFLDLQIQLENKLKQNTRIESQFWKFHRFIFASHIKAYLKQGFFLLSLKDQFLILKTLDYRDAFFPFLYQKP